MKRYLLPRFFLPLAVIVLPIVFCIGNILYGNWVEYKRINDLTKTYGDELFEAVERYENAFSLAGYAQKNELSQYATGAHLESLLDAWELVNNGESILVATSLDSPQVVSYRGNTAELVVEVHRIRVKYGTTGPEVIDSSDWTTITAYTLQLDNGIWKVWLKDSCGLSDQRCIRSLKRIKERWYHRFTY